jgi:hypothetical protein
MGGGGGNLKHASKTFPYLSNSFTTDAVAKNVEIYNPYLHSTLNNLNGATPPLFHMPSSRAQGLHVYCLGPHILLSTD